MQIGVKRKAGWRGRSCRSAGGTVRLVKHSFSSLLEYRKQLFRTTLREHEQTNSFLHLSNPKPGHTTGGSGRGARLGGGAGPGRTGRRQNNSPRRHASLVPPKASKTRLLNVSPEARTSEIPCKPMEEHNDRLTSG